MAPRVPGPTSEPPGAWWDHAGPIRMPRWSDRGPYRLDLGGLLDQASADVQSRPELRDRLLMLPEPTDLVAVISGQRELILAGVSDLEQRAASLGFRLRDLLFSSLVSDLDDGELSQMLAAAIDWLGPTIELLEHWGQEGLDQLSGQAILTRSKDMLGIADRRSAIVTTLQRRDPAKRQIPEVGQENRTPAAARHAASQFLHAPESRNEQLRRELALCRALDSDLRNELDMRLTAHVPAAREQREFRALETEWVGLEREIRAALDKAALAEALTVLNEAVVAATASRMHVASLDGLRSALTVDKVVITTAFDRLTSKLQQRSEGSFGIAGPRGVGKTTLIRYLTTSTGSAFRGGADPAEARAGKPRLGVLVSAPVRYEARDFVLYLHAELCKKVIGPYANQALLERIGERDADASEIRVLLTRFLSTAILGAGMATGGAVLLGEAIRDGIGPGVRPLACVGASLLASAALVLLIFLWDLLGTVRRSLAHQAQRLRQMDMPGPQSATGRTANLPSSLTNRTGGSFSFSSLITLRARARSFQYAAAAAVGGIALLQAGGGWPGGSLQLVAGIALLAVGACCLRCSPPAPRLLIGMSEVEFADVSLMSRDRMRELAVETLLQIRIQQSATTERSRKGTVTGPRALPVGFEVGTKRGITWEERQKTYPELIGDVRSFLGALAEEYEVVIGIDELDKMRTADSVEDFLNDIKGIFGVPGCYYLVSVRGRSSQLRTAGRSIP